MFKTPTVQESLHDDIARKIRLGVLKLEEKDKSKEEVREKREKEIVNEALNKANGYKQLDDSYKVAK